MVPAEEHGPHDGARHCAEPRPHVTAAGDFNKVAAVNVSFWIGKVVATTVGDRSGDARSISLRLGYVLALLMALAAFVPLLVAQLRTKRYVPGLYWALRVSSSAVGARISDAIDRTLRWGNPLGTAVLLGGTIIAPAAWFRRRRTLGAGGVRTPEDERYYWLAAVLANSLGSALGDRVGDKLAVGVLGGTAVNAGILALLLAGYRTGRAPGGLLFWAAFAVSRVPFLRTAFMDCDSDRPDLAHPSDAYPTLQSRGPRTCTDVARMSRTGTYRGSDAHPRIVPRQPPTRSPAGRARNAQSGRDMAGGSGPGRAREWTAAHDAQQARPPPSRQ